MTIRTMLAALTLAVLLAVGSCAGPESESEQGSVDLRSRDITWPTYGGEFDRPATPNDPEEEPEPSAE